MTIPHYDIVIATPGHSMKAEYVKSLIDTTIWLNEQGLTYCLTSQYSSFVPSARENTATGSYGADWEAVAFGAGKFTYGQIVWIDSDISWKVEAFETLIKSDKEIIAGMMPVDRTGRLGAMRLNSAGNPTSLNSRDFIVEGDPVEVDGVSFGFLKVTFGVFEKMSRPWFDLRYASIETTDFPVLYGEDYSWCIKAKESGFKVWMHPLVRVEHHKEIILTV
jgi:hypothetical protein